MKLLLSALILLCSATGYSQSVSCLYTAVNASQRQFFSQYGVIQGFGPGCLVVQQDTGIVYEWDGSAYNMVGGGGSGLLSLNAQTGQTQVFANDTNVVVTSSNNTHTLGFSGTLSVARGGSGAALSPGLGKIVYTDASKMALLASGTSGQFLQSNGAAAPSWGTPAAGITSFNAQTGATQVFANDTNIVVTSSNNTHSLGFSGTLSMARGGSGAALTAANGGIIYSSASAMAVLASGTSGQVLQSNGAAAPSWVAASSGANTALSNLASTAVNANIVPDGNNTRSLGDNTHNWDTISVSTLNNNSAMNINGGSILTLYGSTIDFGNDATPVTDNTQSLGISSKGWKDIYSYNHKLKGSTSGVLTVIPAATTSTYTLTLPTAAGAAGSVLYYSGSGVLSVLAPGTAGQVLTSGGAGAPTWQ